MKRKSKIKSNQIYPNEDLWYIRYKDPISGKWKARSTGLSAKDENLPAAEKIRDKVLNDLQELLDVDYTEGSIQDAFNEFKAKNINKSKSTIDSYNYFFGFLQQKFNVKNSCLVITKKTSEDFLLYINQLDGYSQNTKFGVVKNFSKFLKFLFEYNYIPKPFTINSDVKTRMPKGDPKIFSDADRKKILNSLGKQEKNNNFKLMVNMLMYTGLRPSDIIDITVDQVDLVKMQIKFRSSKVDKWYNRPILPNLKTILRQRIKEVKSGRLFDYAEVKNMGKAFSRYLEDIELDNKEYDLRTFRKDFISRCQEAGIAISAASMLAGHSKINTTMEYYTTLSTEFLRKELNKLG